MIASEGICIRFRICTSIIILISILIATLHCACFPVRIVCASTTFLALQRIRIRIHIRIHIFIHTRICPLALA